jgi:hypothetical protein
VIDIKKKALRQLLLIVVIIYTVAIFLGLIMFFYFPLMIEEYISLIPFIVAIPAALLTRAFQRRASYINSLQGIWPKIVKSGRKAIEYTYIKNPNEQLFKDVVLTLSTSIDHLRMLFKNIGGFYPVESIKTIYEEFDRIRDTYKFENPEGARNRISALWHQARDAILEEFDRVIPTKYDAPDYSKQYND